LRGSEFKGSEVSGFLLAATGFSLLARYLTPDFSFIIGNLSSGKNLVKNGMNRKWAGHGGFSLPSNDKSSRWNRGNET
jgi:hypothetical protein